MRCVVQRVASAAVAVSGGDAARMGAGLVVFVGLGQGDTVEDLDWIAGKVSRLRVFDDAEGKMNLAIGEVGGSLCVVSQFTLYGDCRKGNRPSWIGAMAVDEARAFWPIVRRRFEATGIPCIHGEFQATMTVELVNDGPVTVLLDSGQRQS